MYKRWRSENKAAELNPNYPIDPEVLKKQEAIQKRVKRL